MGDVSYATSLIRRVGQVMETKNGKYLKYIESHFSRVVASSSGIPANKTIDFFNNPADIGTVSATLTGAARHSLSDGKPNGGEIFRLLAVGFQIINFGGLTTMALLDHFLRNGFTFQVWIGDDKPYNKEKPVNLAYPIGKNSLAIGYGFVNAASADHEVVNIVQTFDWDMAYKLYTDLEKPQNEYTAVFGSENAMKVQLRNNGGDFAPLTTDMLISCFALTEVARPMKSE